MQAFAILFGAPLTVPVCIALGGIQLRDAESGCAMRFIAGAPRWELPMLQVTSHGSITGLVDPRVSCDTGADLRLAASAELRKDGIDYLLVFDDEFGADEFRRNTARRGLRLAGEYKRARLYQLQ